MQFALDFFSVPGTVTISLLVKQIGLQYICIRKSEFVAITQKEVSDLSLYALSVS